MSVVLEPPARLVLAPARLTAARTTVVPSVLGPSGVAAAAKRCLDVVGALAGIVLLAPLLLAVALLVKVTDPAGPVLYRQQRVGRAGRAVGVLKFRSMRWQYSVGAGRPFATAEDAFVAMGRADLLEEFARDQKVADDPRVSALGRFLRATSLDELPQLFNALAGHLSLVGPRPVVPAELERYGTDATSYLAVRPGITGLWQVSGRSDTSYDARVALDVRYVQHWRLATDLVILVRTVKTVLAREGAR